MTLIAKPVIKNQYWILTDGEQKVGNVIADNNGYEVKIGSQVTHCQSTTDLKKQYNVQFQPDQKVKTVTKPVALFETYPTNGDTYNSMYDLKRKLHIFTRTQDSKCYYVAGYFAMNLGNEWVTEFCPKYIFIQRYEYLGPFATQEQANSALKYRV